MKAALDHRKELGLALVVLGLFWAASGAAFLLGWRAGAYILLFFGTLAASERFFRIVANTNVRSARIIAACIWAVVVIVAIGTSVVLTVPDFLSLTF